MADQYGERTPAAQAEFEKAEASRRTLTRDQLLSLAGESATKVANQPKGEEAEKKVAETPSKEEGESEEAEGEAENEPEDPEFDVPNLGKVKASELKTWKEGALREKDYTEKTQELAKEKKTLQELWNILESRGVLDLFDGLRDNTEFQKDPKAFIKKIKTLPAFEPIPKMEGEEWEDVSESVKKSFSSLSRQLAETQARLDKFETRQANSDQERAEQAFDDGMALIKEMAQKEGFEYTPEWERKVLKHIADTNATFKGAFDEVIGPEILKNLRAELASIKGKGKGTDKKKLETTRVSGGNTVPSVIPKPGSRPSYLGRKVFSREELLKHAGIAEK
uniref:Uncharacterized protein n=1 Tax=viral metagenome TaxID=1070528 RepID=A0A6M3XQP2_9ZZZZ